MDKVEKFVSREKKIFNFLVFYLFLALFLVILFINSGGQIFIETAMLVLTIEIVVTRFVERGKPLYTNSDVCRELNKIDEIDEYNKLRDEYVNNKDSTILIALFVYFIGIIVFLFLTKFNTTILTLSIAGFMILYFSVYLFFRYKLNKVTIVLLERRKIIKEMRREKRKKEEEMKKKREERNTKLKKSFSNLKKLTGIGKSRKKKTKKRTEKKKKIKKKKTKEGAAKKKKKIKRKKKASKKKRKSKRK